MSVRKAERMMMKVPLMASSSMRLRSIRQNGKPNQETYHLPERLLLRFVFRQIHILFSLISVVRKEAAIRELS
jgi:hypothetical protein